MPESKSRILVGLLFGILTTISIGEASWGLSQIVTLREKQAEHETELTTLKREADKLRLDGSPSLQIHEKKDDERVKALTGALDDLKNEFRSATTLNATMRDGFARMDERLKAIESKLGAMKVIQ